MYKIIWSRLKKVTSSLATESGIGLVETLVAVAIIGVGAVAFLGALSTGSTAVRVQDEGTTAQALAQTQMETIKASAYDPDGSSYTTISTPAGYTVSIGTNPNIYTDNDIQKITVTIFHNGNAVYILENYKVNR
jgi:type II secretory pathway pseudopilin PulG